MATYTEKKDNNWGLWGLLGVIGLFAFVGVKVFILKPSGIKLIGPLIIEPRRVVWNPDFPEAVSISATAENPTDAPATRDISLVVGGKVVVKQTISINSGLQQAILFDIVASPQNGITKVGDYTITLDGLSGRLTVISTGTIDVQLEDLVLTANNPYDPATSPSTDFTSQFWPDELFYINLYARSYGTLPGSKTFTLTITHPDGTVETHNFTFNLDARDGANDRQWQHLSVYYDVLGNYIVTANGLKDTFAVREVKTIQVANLDFSSPADLQQWVFATTWGTPYIDDDGNLAIYSRGGVVCNDYGYCGPYPTYANGVNPNIGKVTNGQFIVRWTSQPDAWTRYGECANVPYIAFRSQMTPANLDASGYRLQLDHNRPYIVIPGRQPIWAYNAPSVPVGTFAVYRVTWFEGFDKRGISATIITVEFQQPDGSWLPFIYQTIYATSEPLIYDYNHSYLNSQINSIGVGIYGSCSTASKIDYLQVWKDMDKWA